MTTIQNVVDALHALNVDGVRRKVKYPVQQISNADLPYQFLMFPAAEYEPLTTCANDDLTIAVQMAVATEPLSSGNYATNYATVITMADALNTALKTLTVGALRTWTIQTALGQPGTPPLFVAGVPYYGVYATVTIRG